MNVRPILVIDELSTGIYLRSTSMFSTSTCCRQESTLSRPNLNRTCPSWRPDSSLHALTVEICVNRLSHIFTFQQAQLTFLFLLATFPAAFSLSSDSSLSSIFLCPSASLRQTHFPLTFLFLFLSSTSCSSSFPSILPLILTPHFRQAFVKTKKGLAEI